MKHLIRIRPTAETNERMAASGGPGQGIARLVERFRPEMFYVSPKRKEIFMVCDLAPADVEELLVAGSRFAGQDPEVIAVVDGAEFTALATQGVCAV